MNFDSGSMTLDIEPTDIGDVGTYSVVLTVTDDDSVGSGTPQVVEGGLNVEVLEPEPVDCFVGSYTGVDVELYTSASIDVENYSTETECESAEFSFQLSGGGGVPSLFSATGSSLAIMPSAVEEVASYTLEA